jgi:hypothetical protein
VQQGIEHCLLARKVIEGHATQQCTRNKEFKSGHYCKI